jgi:hypothetical protein
MQHVRSKDAQSGRGQSLGYTVCGSAQATRMNALFFRPMHAGSGR